MAVRIAPNVASAQLAQSHSHFCGASDPSSVPWAEGEQALLGKLKCTGRMAISGL